MWGRKCILKFLRNFGQFISHIEYFDFEESKLYLIEYYLAEYCSKTLTTLTLERVPKFLFKCIPVQFTKLEKIRLFHQSMYNACDLPLIQSFPNLKSVSLYTDHSHYPSEPPEFPYLKRLKVNVGGCMTEFDSGRRENYVIQLLRSNQDLINLKIYSSHKDHHIKFVRFASDYLLNLEILAVRAHSYWNNDETFHFEKVEDFSFNTFFECLKRIPFTFRKLERFRVVLNGKGMQPCISDFIVKNVDLKILHVNGINSNSSFDDLVSVLSKTNIEELILEDYEVERIPSDKFISFLRENQILKKVTLTVSWMYGNNHFNDEVKAHICKKTKLTWKYFDCFTFSPRNMN